MTLQEWEELAPAQARRTLRGALAASRYAWWAIAAYALLVLILMPTGFLPAPSSVAWMVIDIVVCALSTGFFTAAGIAGSAFALSIREREPHHG